MQRSDVLRAIDIITLNKECDDRGLVGALTRAGFSKLEAEQLVTFVPLAFSRPVLERLGVSNIPESFTVMTREGRWIHMSLASQPVYVLAASIIGDPQTMASMSNTAYKHLVTRCHMLNAANHALNVGEDLADTAVAVALNNLSAEDLGYLPWWRKLRRTLLG
jgi:hypothetical protein